MRAPLSLLLSLLLLAGPASAVGVNAKTGRSGTGQNTGSGAAVTAGSAAPAVLAVPALDASLSPLSAPALAPKADLSGALTAASALPAAPAQALPAPGDARRAPQAPAPAASANLPPYAQTLIGAGASPSLVARLDAFLASHHPGEQDRIYHGLQHSRDVAGVAARMAADARQDRADTVLVVLAAALHDLDPERAPGAPPAVAATVAYLAANAEARFLLAEFSALFGFTSGQVTALIRATDFNPDPEKLEGLKDLFARSAAAEFPAGRVAWALHWGLRLSVADKTAAYLGSERQSLAFVKGLAGEFRAAATAAAGKPAGPTDAAIVADSHKFLGNMAASPEMYLLPADLRERYEATRRYFTGLASPEAAAAALEGLGASAPTRGPPERSIRDLAAANRYIASIAGNIKLDERQKAALFEQWLEEKGIPAGSERALDVKRLLAPEATAADEAALAGVPPALRKHRASLLKLAREHATTPAAISATLESKGLTRTLAAVDERTFEDQAWLAMRRASLERAVRRYPDTAQGAFMRELAGHMAAPGGKSVEEVAREGVFAYVDFAGDVVSKAYSGRDPDVQSAQMVFYVTRREEKWHVEGYRQNRALDRSDAELARRLKAWLARGGIPAADFD